VTVYFGKRNDGIPVLIKVINDYRSCEDLTRDEIWILKSCWSPNIAGFLDAYYFENEVWIVMEFCRGGTLADLIPTTTLTEPHIAYITREILKGLKYLHDKNHYNRDLRCETVILDLNSDVRIADIDVCDDLMTTVDERLYLFGPRSFIPPEMIGGQKSSTKIDIWALGCICYQMATGHAPYHTIYRIKGMFMTGLNRVPRFPGDEDLKLPFTFNPQASSVASPSEDKKKKKNAWSDSFKDFVYQCLQPDQYLRPSAETLLGHPFLQNACQGKEISKLVEVAFWFSTTE